jgi:hypothetical protein
MHPPKQRRTTGIMLGVLAALLIVGAALYFLYRPQVVQLVEHILPRCYVGIQGTAASITFIGINAEKECQQWVQYSHHACENEPNCTPLFIYELSSEPTQPVLCEGDYQNNHVIVRDEGLFDLIGSWLCSRFFPSSSQTNGTILAN